MAARRDKTQTFRASRIVIAIAVGALLGCILSMLHPRSSFRIGQAIRNRRIVNSDLQISSSSCESDEQIKLLKADVVSLSEDNADLKKQVRELEEKLQVARHGEEKRQKKQVVFVGEGQKAGPFGTVKGTRTSPTVARDESANPKLAELLKEVARENELIVALANSNVKDALQVWFTNIKRVGIPNYLVVALDDETASFCSSNSVPFYAQGASEGIDSAAKSGTNHAVSGLKFHVLREFLQLGYSILLSDVDVVFLQNPFHHLRRDSDVESMSDGHDNATAYGYDDVFDEPGMGWARYVHSMRIWVYNSGFFYVRATVPCVELLDRVAARLAHQPSSWDQAVYNEELFFPSRPGYVGLHASKRTMDFYLFMNSKVLFKTVRRDPALRKLMPVVVHVNYHPDKLDRMKAVVDFYVHGKQDALDPFPDGSEW